MQPKDEHRLKHNILNFTEILIIQGFLIYYGIPPCFFRDI